MKRMKGWPVTYMGIASLSTGSWINGGPDSGLIVAGLCLIAVGIIQLATND